MTNQKRNIPKATFFGRNLKFLRRVRGMSQTELASAVALTRGNIASYESGVVEPNANNFLKFCDFLDVSPRELLNRTFEHDATEVIAQTELPQQPLEQYLADQIDLFTFQTNRITKIIEGHRAMAEFNDDKIPQEPTVVQLIHFRDRLVDILSALVKSNWSLIQSFTAEQEEE